MVYRGKMINIKQESLDKYLYHTAIKPGEALFDVYVRNVFIRENQIKEVEEVPPMRDIVSAYSEERLSEIIQAGIDRGIKICQ